MIGLAGCLPLDLFLSNFAKIDVFTFHTSHRRLALIPDTVEADRVTATQQPVLAVRTI